jgi:hypothetical protein
MTRNNTSSSKMRVFRNPLGDYRREQCWIAAINVARFSYLLFSEREVVSVHRKSEASHVEVEAGYRSPRIFDNET